MPLRRARQFPAEVTVVKVTKVAAAEHGARPGLFLALGRQKQEDLSIRKAWSTWRVPGQPGFQNETLPLSHTQSWWTRWFMGKGLAA